MKKEDGLIRWGKVIIYLLGIVAGFWLIWLLIMMIWNHFCFRDVSDDAWMQLISSFILTVPTVLICGYAAYQTDKYAKLDAERLRPELLFRSAKISVCMVDRAKLYQFLHAPEDRRDNILIYQNDRMDRGDIPDVGYLSLAANIRLHSGESIREITIHDIKVHIGGESFTMGYGAPVEDGRFVFLTRNFRDGCEEYHLEFQPEYKDLPEKKERFGKLMWNAIAASEYDVTKRAMEWHIHMGVTYGINQTRAGEKSVHAVCKLKWDRTKKTFVNNYTFRRRARDGIVSICLKKGECCEEKIRKTKEKDPEQDGC